MGKEKKEKKKEEFANYRDGDTIWILLNQDQCHAVVDDWIECNYICPLKVERSKKHHGMFVITTKSLMWACRIIRWHGYEQVTYKSV